MERQRWSEIESEREKQTQRDREREWERGPHPETPLTRRSRPSLSSGHRCPSPGEGAEEAGGGRRAPGLSVLWALPPRSQPGLQCHPRCLGSEAAHRTGGGEARGREPQGGVSASKKPPDLGTQEMPPLCPGTRLSVPQVSKACLLMAPMSTELLGGTEGPVSQPSLGPLDGDKRPVRDP